MSPHLPAKKKYYAVVKGRQPGIYDDYHEVLVQTQRYPHSKYRAFANRSDAENYLYTETTKPQSHEMINATILVQFDGGSRGNPGKAGSGVVIIKKNAWRWESYKYLGDKVTNNEAEYEGILMGLRFIHTQQLHQEVIEVQGDSKLVINQLSGTWMCNAEHLYSKYEEAKQLMSQCATVQLTWIPREKNQTADRLSNDAMNTEGYKAVYVHHACA